VICVAPIQYTGLGELKRDIENFKGSASRREGRRGVPAGGGASSAIPDRKNEYYRNDEDLLVALAEALRTEYKTIVDSGILLQVDDARAAVTYDRMVPREVSKTTIDG